MLVGDVSVWIDKGEDDSCVCKGGVIGSGVGTDVVSVSFWLGIGAFGNMGKVVGSVTLGAIV
jgi:hypothetical protein